MNLEQQIDLQKELTNIALDEVAPPEKKPTIKEIRNLRRQFFTVRRDTVVACGHKFHPLDTPRKSNCSSCWFAYFQMHGESTQVADEIFKKHGKRGLEQIRGVKFTKFFLTFMAGLVLSLKEIDVEQNVGSIAGSHSADCSETCDHSGEIEVNREDKQGVE